MKFGGTSVGNADAIKQVASIVQNDVRKKKVIVLSACSGTKPFKSHAPLDHIKIATNDTSQRFSVKRKNLFITFLIRLKLCS